MRRTRPLTSAAACKGEDLDYITAAQFSCRDILTFDYLAVNHYRNPLRCGTDLLNETGKGDSIFKFVSLTVYRQFHKFFLR